MWVKYRVDDKTITENINCGCRALWEILEILDQVETLVAQDHRFEYFQFILFIMSTTVTFSDVFFS